MKFITVIFFLCISISVFSQNVNVSDYQVPISKAQTLRFNGSWNWGEVGDSVTSNNANGNLIYQAFYSSLPLAWFIDFDATGSNTASNKSFLYNIQLDARFSKYIWEDKDLFGFSEVNASQTDTSKQIASDLTIGFGYGRYIDATSLAKAVRIEDHLLKDKIISNNLPKEVMLNIAKIIERENEFKDEYGEVYETYWFDAIEQEIKKSDVLTKGSIGSIGILRMRQVLFGINERVNPRYYGWDVTAGILFPLTTADKSPVGNPNLSIGARYAIPLNWSIQINITARAYTPLDTAFFKIATLSAGAGSIYELSNKINFVSSYSLGIFKPYSGIATINHELNESFWFYLENNIYLTIAADLLKQGNNPKNLTTSMGLQYNLF
jgi:hypothetical protein